MSGRVLIVCLAACAAACSPSPPSAQSRSGSPEPSPAAVPRPAAAAASAVAVAGAGAVGASRVEEDDGLLEFSYRHPAAAGAIPPLRAILEAGRDEARLQARRDAEAEKAGAAQTGYPFHPHALEIAWEVVADTPRFLSLSQSFYRFSGGAHGNYGSTALLWDRREGRRVEAADLFTSKAALESALRAPFCAALDRERRRKGIEPPGQGNDPFPRCIDPLDEAAVILGSAGRDRFDRIGFLIDPYVAGPYAEGGYEVTLPVTLAILRVVRPEYRDAFALRQARPRKAPAVAL